MTTYNFTGTATDLLGAAASDGYTLTSTGSAPARVVTRSLLANRVMWGQYGDIGTKGPKFSDDVAEVAPWLGGRSVPPQPMTLTCAFTVEIACRFTGFRVYKAPNAAGSVSASLWSAASATATTGTLLGTQSMGTWTADTGGWRQVTFATPVILAPGTQYYVGYCTPNGIYSYSSYVFNGQDVVVWPFVVKMFFNDGSGGMYYGSGTGFDAANAAVNTFPTFHSPSSYYIDPQVEWDDIYPGYYGGTAYWDQWSDPHPYSRFPFMIAIDFADPPYLADYYAMGFNTLQAGDPSDPNYQAAMASIGYAMDWWPYMWPLQPKVPNALADNASMRNQVRAVMSDDEPDQVGGKDDGFHSPSRLRDWVAYYRQRDSTRPIYLNFGYWVSQNQGYAWAPSGAGPLQENQLWREWAATGDILSCDNYTMSHDNDPYDQFGIWTYPYTILKVREICDDAKPVIAVIETTSQTPGQPTPDQVVKATWASLIAGARGLDFFDHRFAGPLVTQDFAAMLHDPPMKAAMTALFTRVTSLGPALMAVEANLVTAYTSSNTTAGPKGGTFGVPIHYTSRIVGSNKYVFAQAIRPGATTGTLTIPSWASHTVEVIDESRTLTVSGGGVLTDSFAADYTFHLYHLL